VTDFNDEKDRMTDPNTTKDEAITNIDAKAVATHEGNVKMMTELEELGLVMHPQELKQAMDGIGLDLLLDMTLGEEGKSIARAAFNLRLAERMREHIIQPAYDRREELAEDMRKQRAHKLLVEGAQMRTTHPSAGPRLVQ